MLIFAFPNQYFFVSAPECRDTVLGLVRMYVLKSTRNYHMARL